MVAFSPVASSRGRQGRLGAHELGNVEYEEVDRCPWDSCLRFSDARLEADFMESQHVTQSKVDLEFGVASLFAPADKLTGWCCCVKVDVTSYLVYLLANPLKMMSWSTTCFFATCVHHGWMVSAMIATRVLSSRCRTCSWPYSSQEARTHFMTWFRILTCIMSMIVVAVEDSSHLFDDVNTHAKILSKTPIAPLIFTAIAFWLPFRNICATQAISTLVTAPWIWILASECRGNSLLASAVNRVSVSTETYVVYAGLPIGVTANATTSWLQVGSFYHILYGFILPLSGCYLVEAWLRIRFIRERDVTFTDKELSQFFWRSVQCVMFVDVIAVQLLWAILKEFRI